MLPQSYSPLRSYFRGEIEFGVISQASFAYSRIDAALSVIINNLATISGLAVGAGYGGACGGGQCGDKQAGRQLCAPFRASYRYRGLPSTSLGTPLSAAIRLDAPPSQAETERLDALMGAMADAAAAEDAAAAAAARQLGSTDDRAQPPGGSSGGAGSARCAACSPGPRCWSALE